MVLRFIPFTMPENYAHCVELKATRQTFNKTTDSNGRIVEITRHYKGNVVLGEQIRTSSGYRYYLRVDETRYREWLNKGY